MKTTFYRGLYHVFLFLSKYFDNRLFTTCKLLAASGLLACTAGCRDRTTVPPQLPPTPLPESVAPAKGEEKADAVSAPADTTAEEEKQIFCYVKETMPKFPGGDAELLRFIGANLDYPEEARKLGLEGRVIVTMRIDTLGRALPLEVIRGVHPLLDSAALEVVRKMPRWSPGEVSGRRVTVKYTVPITFKLDKDSLPNQTK